jgi:flagellar FliL protein
MSNKILVILIGFLVVLMLGLGGGLFMMWSKMSALDNQFKAQNSEQPGQPAALEEPLGPIVSLDTFIVNLADKGGTRYLRLTIDLELGTKELEKEIEKRLPQVRDSILMILPTKRFADINTAAGKIALRDEIMEKINSFLSMGKITNIFFKEFVVQ